MRKKLLASILIGLFVLVSTCGIFLHWIFTPPKNTPCTPISYPNGNKLDVESTKIYSFEPDESYLETVDFYRTNLKFDPPLETKYEMVEWGEYPIRDIGVLFQCGSKLNGYELELGCIFVRDKNGKGVIDITWSYSEGPAIPCYVLPGIEPEDYLLTP